MGTKYRRGFKAEADEYAREFREELGLRHYEPLSPWALAEHLLIPVISLSDLEEQEPDKVNHLIYADPQCFSAATVFNGSKRLIVVNEAHSEGRQASNLSHEGSNAKLWGFLNKNGTFSIVMRMLSLAQQLPTTFGVLLRDFVYM